MDRHATRSVDIPKWSALLVEAVNKPGMIMEAYSAFHHYSTGNQILAMVQRQMRGLEPGPINTFPGWQALGRSVKAGERALILCMPIIRKCRDEEADEGERNEENGARAFTSFMHKARWFVISQTIGDEFTPPRLPEWDAEQALAALDIEQIAFTDTDGNCQGFARKRQVAINPVAQLVTKTLFHEAAHLCRLQSYVVLFSQVVWDEASTVPEPHITFCRASVSRSSLVVALLYLTSRTIE